ncbi:uncharacterized protein LOC144477876, partial [Augochlora pura]
MSRTRFSDFVLVLCLIATIGLAECKNEYTKLFDRCASEKNAFDCLKRRALEILDSAIYDDQVYVLNDYVSIAKDPAVSARSDDGGYKEQNATELSLDQKLDQKFHQYLASRSVKLTIPGDAFE